MVTSLFKHDRIRTTDAKAKELRRWADQLVTLAKRGDLHARRQAMAIIREKDVVHKLFTEAPKRFAEVSGGYTRVVKIGMRPGDAAPISLVELVTPEPKKKKKPRRRKKAAPAVAATPAVTPESATTEAETTPEATTPEPSTEAKADAPAIDTPDVEADAAPEDSDPSEQKEEK
jgi:large subunit ribosomal protein L17